MREPDQSGLNCSNRNSTAVSLLAVFVFALCTYARNQVWRTDIGLWNDVIRKSPAKFRAYGNRGLIYAGQDEWKAALKDFNQAAALHPGHAPSYTNRGDAYFYTQDYENAIKDYTQAIEMGYESSDTFHNRGLIYENVKNDLAAALNDYSRALLINPESEQVFCSRANLFLKLQEHRKAVLDFSYIIHSPEFRVRALVGRSVALTKLNRMNEALADIMAAQRLQPENPELAMIGEDIRRRLAAASATAH